MQTGPDGCDRGQMIIVAALVIATIFVGLALVLNSGIYAENLSSRETTDAEGALSFTLATDDAIAAAYERTNAANESSASAAAATFNAAVDGWTDAQQRRAATQGIGIDVERTPHVGWRLEQADDGEFVPAEGGTEDWQLVDGADGVAAFELNVTRGDLHEPADESDAASAFHVAIDGSDSTDGWNLYVFQNDTQVVVHAGDPTTYSNMTELLEDDETCAKTADRAVVDLRNETLAGEACEALNFSNDLDGTVDVSFGNPDQVNGTYALVVDGSDAAETSNFEEPDSGSEPTAQAIIYSASYASHYGKADLSHSRYGTFVDREETYAS